MHLSKSRLKKKGSKPQMSAGRGRGPREQQAPPTQSSREQPKGAAVAPSHILLLPAPFFPASRPPCKCLVFPKLPLTLTATIPGQALTVPFFLPTCGWEDERNTGGQSVTLSQSLSFLWLGSPNSLACPLFRREQGYTECGHSLCPLPQSVQLASAHLA